MDQPFCANPDCRLPFSPKRKDQRFCHRKCKDHYYHLKKSEEKADIEAAITCEHPGCTKKVTLTKRQARYRKDTFGLIVCNFCKKKMQKKMLKKKSIDEQPITDPYIKGIFVPGDVPSNSILVCPHQ